MADTTDIDQTTPSSKSSLGEDRLTQIRSDEVDDLLSYVPHWIIRWGISIIFGVMGLLFFASWVIEYPDVITAPISVYTQNPPASIVSHTDGKIIKLFVKDNDQVKPYTHLAVLENPAYYEDYVQLKSQLDSCKIRIHQDSFWVVFTPNRFLNLGELQPDYSDFLQKLNNYKLFHRLNFQTKKIHALNTQIGILNQLQERLKNQKNLLQKESDLAEKNYTTNKSLFEKGLLSEIELTSMENDFLQKKYNLESAESSIISNTIKISEYEQDILDYDQQWREQRDQLSVGLQESFKKLSSAAALWEQRYLLVSPIEGRVSFYKFWSPNQYVTENEEIMAIVPESTDMIGKIFLKGHGIGKIREGQQVKIKFEGFPYHEFGLVSGEVQNVSLAAHESAVSVTVHLPEGLTTSYNKKLDFKQGLSGQAEIITEDLKLIERIFNQFRYLFTDVIKP